MIAISGVLVIVAIGLLVTGVLLTSDIYLWFIFASIAVSLASAVCLVVGVFIGRGQSPTRGRAAKSSGKAAASKEKRKAPGKPAAKRPAAKKKPAQQAPVDGTGEVVVVPGRLRYHLASCRQVTGRDTETHTVDEARCDGYAACTACRPDSVLAARAQAETDDAEAVDDELAEEPAAAAAEAGGGGYELGVRFDIDELGGLYGLKAYRILFDSLEPRRLAGCSLHDGDTSETLAGSENAYCIVIQAADRKTIEYVREALSERTDEGLAPLDDRFLDGDVVDSEPVVHAGDVDRSGDLIVRDNEMITAEWGEGTPWRVVVR